MSNESDQYRKRWRHAQLIVNHFWRRWLREYLPELTQQQKWLVSKPNVKKGDLVYIMDENMPRGSWPLGLVVEVNEGRDGLVRSASLKTKMSYQVRPITKLVLLQGVHCEWTVFLMLAYGAMIYIGVCNVCLRHIDMYCYWIRVNSEKMGSVAATYWSAMIWRCYILIWSVPMGLLINEL